MDTNPTDVMLAKARADRERGGQSPTPMQLVEALGVALDRLETQLDRLHEHLEPVLVEAPPRPALAGEPAPGRTLLAQRLMHLAAWAERLGDVATELRDRIEL